MNDEQWVEERLRVLAPGKEWNPNAGPALAALQRRDHRRRIFQRSWMWSGALAALCFLVVAGLPTPAKCALIGVGCPRVAILPVTPLAAVATPPPPPATPPVAVKHEIPKPAVAVSPKLPSKFKETGPPNAPIVCEIYSDYECPACALFYEQTFPRLEAEYVKTGKIRLIHRDFPLPQHPHAKLAARYANAAGELGHYEEVFPLLYRSQKEWAANGNVDATVARVLSPETMIKLRELVENDSRLNATVEHDVSMAMADQINQTPSLVLVHKGTRQKIAGAPSYDLLRSYIEELLSR